MNRYIAQERQRRAKEQFSISAGATESDFVNQTLIITCADVSAAALIHAATRGTRAANGLG